MRAIPILLMTDRYSTLGIKRQVTGIVMTLNPAMTVIFFKRQLNAHLALKFVTQMRAIPILLMTDRYHSVGLIIK